jgi:hypothetical protein
MDYLDFDGVDKAGVIGIQSLRKNAMISESSVTIYLDPNCGSNG